MKTKGLKILGMVAVLSASVSAWSFPAQNLDQAVQEYQAIVEKGGWPKVPGSGPLKQGDSGERVAALRARLAVTHDLDPGLAQGDQFDEALVEAVKHFQTRHGEGSDGVVGKETLDALNISADHRLQQLLVNQKRWATLEKDERGRAIFVNIPDYTLTALENGHEALTMKVIVGKDYTSTPTFSSKMQTVVLNPTWNVPPEIAEKEILPKLKTDPNYLAAHNMEMVKGQVHQKPGPKNSLGQVKFLFPNKHDVYLHDTPNDSLFNKEERAFSHGCIRLEKPIDLAVWVLQGSEWSRDRITAAIHSGQQKSIALPSKIPVHLFYGTAWVEDNQVQFREDLYDRDTADASKMSAADSS